MQDLSTKPQKSDDRKIHEECGIVGVISRKPAKLANDLYYTLFALQHRGQESAGIAVESDKRTVAYYKNLGLTGEVFTPDKMELFPETQIALGHVRYATQGSNNVTNAQPIVFYGRYGRMALAHNGSLVNADRLKEQMIKTGHIYQSSTDTEVLASLINEYSEESVEKGIVKAAEQLVGAFAFVLLADEKLYAVRDRHGLKPLIMGKKEGQIIFASESCALDTIEAEIVRDVKPGEVICVDKDGTVSSTFLKNPCLRPCVFEYVYLARTDSIMDGVSVYDARFKCGQKLAERYKIDADVVAGVPDSAVVVGRGYAAASGIPYVDALSKNRYIGRTFIQPVQSQRENSVRIKLNAYRANVAGKRVILIDDSIVRGTTCMKIVKFLRQSGATEVHLVIASPVVRKPCFFGVDMQTEKQLIGGNGRTVEEIRKLIGADSLHYIPLEDLKECCGGYDFCTGCFDGNYSMPVDTEDFDKFKEE